MREWVRLLLVDESQTISNREGTAGRPGNVFYRWNTYLRIVPFVRLQGDAEDGDGGQQNRNHLNSAG